ncbi:MAG TPA: hypothetical protein VF681_14640 [Abditibacteriaceae bacterium]|jgi:hypothetical protein
MNRKFGTLYERLVANTRLAVEDNPSSCWLWTGSTAGDSDYPRVPVRVPGKTYPQNRAAHRVMIEEFLDVDFPFDDAGHKCCNPRCISPMHLEPEAPALNHAVKRTHAHTSGRYDGEDRMIPVLFPRAGHPDNDPGLYDGEPHPPGEPCPF